MSQRQCGYGACSRSSVIALLLSNLGVTGCLSVDDEQALGQRGQRLSDGSDVVELVVNGRLFVKSTAMSEGELKAISDPELWNPPETVDKLAQLLREVILDPEHGTFVEAAPNYELAEISLKSQEEELQRPHDGLLLPATDGLETITKSISTNGDQRSQQAIPQDQSYLGFYEAGGSGTSLMNGVTVYTAGHVVYNNAEALGADGWYCANNSTSTDGSCPGSYFPRWRFAGRIVSGSAVWSTPWRFGLPSVPMGWVNMPAGASATDRARWDYARVSFDSSLGVAAQGMAVNASQATLRARTLHQEGYPVYWTCPALSLGSSNAAGGDCPASGAQGVVQLRPTATTRPYTGAQMHQTVELDTGTTVGTAYIRTGTLDITTGHSGGPLWYFADGGFQAVVGVAANTANGSTNTYFNRLTTEVRTFLGL